MKVLEIYWIKIIPYAKWSYVKLNINKCKMMWGRRLRLCIIYVYMNPLNKNSVKGLWCSSGRFITKKTSCISKYKTTKNHLKTGRMNMIEYIYTLSVVYRFLKILDIQNIMTYTQFWYFVHTFLNEQNQFSSNLFEGYKVVTFLFLKSFSDKKPLLRW